MHLFAKPVGQLRVPDLETIRPETCCRVVDAELSRAEFLSICGMPSRVADSHEERNRER